MSCLLLSLSLLVLVPVATSQGTGSQSLCAGMRGGTCVSGNVRCAPGYREHATYSNFYGCRVPYARCCVYDDRQLPTQACGIGSGEPTDRVLNGDPAGACNWPFVVSIRSIRTDARGQPTLQNTIHACGGVLVASDWVLTSAFCILSGGNSAREAMDQLLIVTGEYNINVVEQREQTFRASNVIIHDQYAYSSASQIQFDDTRAINSNSLALIRLDRHIDYNCSGVVCLPTAAEANNQNLNFDQCVITGWGFTQPGAFDPVTGDDGLLKMSFIKLMSPSAADYITQRFNYTDIRPEGTTMQGPRDRNTDSCLGDEGGPIMCSNGERWYVRGIIPFNLCFSDSFNLFVTATTFYQRWIESTMARFNRFGG